MFDFNTNTGKTFGERHLSNATTNIVESSSGNWGPSPSTPNPKAPASAPSSQQAYGPESGLVLDSPTTSSLFQIRSGSAATTAPSSPLRGLYQRQLNIVSAKDLSTPLAASTPTGDIFQTPTSYQLKLTDDEDGDGEHLRNSSLLSFDSPFTSTSQTATVSMFDALLFCPSVPFHTVFDSGVDDLEATKNNFLEHQLGGTTTSSNGGGGELSNHNMLKRFYEASNDLFSPLTPVNPSSQLPLPPRPPLASPSPNNLPGSAGGTMTKARTAFDLATTANTISSDGSGLFTNQGPIGPGPISSVSFLGEQLPGEDPLKSFSSGHLKGFTQFESSGGGLRQDDSLHSVSPSNDGVTVLHQVSPVAISHAPSIYDYIQLGSTGQESSKIAGRLRQEQLDELNFFQKHRISRKRLDSFGDLRDVRNNNTMAASSGSALPSATAAISGTTSLGATRRSDLKDESGGDPLANTDPNAFVDDYFSSGDPSTLGGTLPKSMKERTIPGSSPVAALVAEYTKENTLDGASVSAHFNTSRGSSPSSPSQAVTPTAEEADYLFNPVKTFADPRATSATISPPQSPPSSFSNAIQKRNRGATSGLLTDEGGLLIVEQHGGGASSASTVDVAMTSPRSINAVSASAWENTSETATVSRTNSNRLSLGGTGYRHIKEREGSLLSVISEARSNSPAPATSPTRGAILSTVAILEEQPAGGMPFANNAAATPPSPRTNINARQHDKARFSSVERRGFGFADYQAHTQLKQQVVSGLPTIGANMLSSSGVYPSPSLSPVPAPQVEPPPTFSSHFEAASLAAVRIVAGRFMFNPNDMLTSEKLDELKRKEAVYVQELEQFARDAILAEASAVNNNTGNDPPSTEGEDHILGVGRSHRVSTAAANNNPTTNTTAAATPPQIHFGESEANDVSFTVDLVDDPHGIDPAHGGDSPTLRLVFSKDTNTPFNPHTNLVAGSSSSTRIASANTAQALRLAQSLQAHSTRWWSPPLPPPSQFASRGANTGNNNTGHFYALNTRSATSSRAATPTINGGSGMSSTVHGLALRTDKLRVGMTPLMVAIALGYELVATALVREYRAFIHEVSPITGESALHVACRCGQFRILRNLLLPATPSWGLLERTNPPIHPPRRVNSLQKHSNSQSKTAKVTMIPKAQRPDRYLTPMGLSVKYKHYDCVIVILQHAVGNTALAKQLLQSAMPPTSYDLINPPKFTSQPTPRSASLQLADGSSSLAGTPGRGVPSVPKQDMVTSVAGQQGALAAPVVSISAAQESVAPAAAELPANGSPPTPATPTTFNSSIPSPVVPFAGQSVSSASGVAVAAPPTPSTTLLHFLCRGSHDTGCSSLLQELTGSNPAVVPVVRGLLAASDAHGRTPLFYCSTLSAIRMLNSCEKGTSTRGGGNGFGDFLNLSFAATVASVTTSPCSSFSSYTWGGSPAGRGGDDKNGPPSAKDMSAVPCDRYGNTPLHVLASAASVITSGPPAKRGNIVEEANVTKGGGASPSAVSSASSVTIATDDEGNEESDECSLSSGEVWEGDAAPLLLTHMTRQVKEVIIKRVLADATGEDEAVECLTTLYTNQRGIPFLHAIVGDQECVQLVIHELGKLFHPLWKVLMKLCSVKDTTPRGNTVLHICANNGWYESLQLLFQGCAVPLNQTRESFLSRSRDIATLFTRTNNDGMAPMFLTAHCPSEKAHNTAAVLFQPAMELLKATVSLKSPLLMMSVCEIFTKLLDTRLANLPETNIVHHFCHTNATEAFRGWRKASRGLLKKESDALNHCKKRLLEVQDFRDKEILANAEKNLSPKCATNGTHDTTNNADVYSPTMALQQKLASEHTYNEVPKPSMATTPRSPPTLSPTSSDVKIRRRKLSLNTASEQQGATDAQGSASIKPLPPSQYDLPLGTPLRYVLRNTLSKMYQARDHDLKTTAIVICLLRGNPLLLGYLVRSIVAAADCQTYLEALRVGNSRGEVSSFLSMSHVLSSESPSGTWTTMDEGVAGETTAPDGTVTLPHARTTPRKAPRFTFPTAPPSSEDLAIIHSVTPPDEADAGTEAELVGLGIISTGESSEQQTAHPFISQLPRQSSVYPATNARTQESGASEQEEIAFASMRDKVMSGTKRFEANKRRHQADSEEKERYFLRNFVPPTWESVTGIALEGDEDVAGPDQEHPHSVKYRKKLMIRLLEKFFIFSSRVVLSFQETSKIAAQQETNMKELVSSETEARRVLWEHHPICYKISRQIPLSKLQYPETTLITEEHLVLSRRHEYLSDGEFLDSFGCAKDIFEKYPPSRQQLLLKRLKLLTPTTEEHTNQMTNTM